MFVCLNLKVSLHVGDTVVKEKICDVVSDYPVVAWCTHDSLYPYHHIHPQAVGCIEFMDVVKQIPEALVEHNVHDCAFLIP